MKEHSNAAILKAYADNTDLVIFMLGSNSKWNLTNPKSLMDYPDDEFFACLPQHNESGQCLHWLNGGEVERWSPSSWVINEKNLSDKSRLNVGWVTLEDEIKEESWSIDCGFMRVESRYRIKARKEKRWIVAKPNALVSMMYFESKESAQDAVNVSVGEFRGGQVIEIEVEV